MKTWKCVEPANLNEGDGYVVLAAADEEILFPHVDSCLAMALVLSDGRLVGGHVGVQWDGNAGLEPADNAVRIMGEMLQKRGNTGISKVVFLGDPAWSAHFIGEQNWANDDPLRPAVPAVKALLPNNVAGTRTLVKGTVDGGVDFLLTTAPSTAIKVSRYKSPHLKLYECTVSTIQGTDAVDFDDAKNAVGQTCSKCGAVHGAKPATFLGYWHVCKKCHSAYCNICGKWKLWREKWFERERLCGCGGKTELVA